VMRLADLRPPLASWADTLRGFVVNRVMRVSRAVVAVGAHGNESVWLAWRPDEIALRWFDRIILAICTVLQLLIWALLALGAFWLHWTIGVVVMCCVLLAPVVFYMQFRAALPASEQPPYSAAPPLL
jgi:hypothetical protein